MEKIDINKMVFSNTPSENKLHYIKTLSNEEILATTGGTILRIYNECHGDRDRFYIKPERRVGNNWNSTIEFIYEYQNKPCVCIYIQNSSTDSSITMSFAEFKRGGTWHGHIAGSYTYQSDDVARTIRCILAEYVYYTDLEKEENLRKEKLASITNWKIFNPVCDYFYDYLRLGNLPFSYATTTSAYKRYIKGKDAIAEYAAEHLDELYGKSEDELKAIYKDVFRTAIG